MHLKRQEPQNISKEKQKRIDILVYSVVKGKFPRLFCVSSLENMGWQIKNHKSNKLKIEQILSETWI